MKKVVKFGGSSLASAEQFKKVGAIISADESRVYVVPSAPGKRFPEDTKVTDMLLHVYETAKAGEDITEEMKAIKARYDEIITGLALKDFSLDKDFEEITKKLVENPQVDYAASRGEFLNGKIMEISTAIRQRRFLVRDCRRHHVQLFPDFTDLAKMGMSRHFPVAVRM